MDTPKLTHVSLCAGYGGIDLGLRRVLPGLRTVAYSEIEEYACGLLAARMEGGHLDPAPIWSDLKTFPFSDFHGCVDILSGGYPCQPFSAAGKRLGADDPRHLWPYIADGIRLCQPRICFFENVEGHISLGLRDVLGDLGRLGYQATWGIFSASEVGAPHQRKRIFILAHRCGTGLEGYLRHVHGPGWASDGPDRSTGPCGVSRWPSRPGEPQHGWEPPRIVGDAASVQDDGRESRNMGQATSGGGGGNHAVECSSSSMGDAKSQRSVALRPEPAGQQREASIASAGNAMGNPNSPRLQERQGQRRAGLQGTHSDGGATSEREAQPAVGRDSDGPASRLDYAELCVSCDNRTDELRLLGNGVVPATAERAFRTLLTQLDHDLR